MLIILILLSDFDNFFKIFKELSVEPSFIATISISFNVCACKLSIPFFKYFPLLYIGRNIDIFGILLKDEKLKVY